MRKQFLISCAVLCYAVLLLLPSSALAKTSHVIDLIHYPDSQWAFEENAEILEVCFPPVQGADACILRKNGQVMLVDAATRGQHNRVAAALDYMGITHVDIGFNSHPHDDHLGGFDFLHQAATLGELYITFPEDANVCMETTLRIMREQGVPVRHVGNGELIPFADVRLEVIQCDVYWFNENSSSAMLRLDYGDCSLLLTADVGTDGQNELLRMCPEKLAADIFKYPHHAVNPAGWNFLKHIDGEMTVITNSRSRVENARRDADWRGLAQAYTCYGMVRLRTDGHIWVVDQIKLDVD